MSFISTDVSRLGVYPSKGGFGIEESDSGNNIEKEFNFSFLMFTQGTNSSGQYYVNHAQSFNAVYSDAKELFLTWVSNNFGSTPVYTDNNINYPLARVGLSQSSDDKDKWDCSLTFKILQTQEQGSEKATPTASPVIGVTDVKYNLSCINTHITRSISSSVLWTATGRTARDYGNRIDYNDGDTKGAEVLTPQLTFQIVVNFSALSAQNLSTLMSMVGSVNSQAWGEFPAGTVLFKGGDIIAEKWEKDETFSGVYWKVTYNFEYSPNTTILSPSGTSLTKNGWSYIWGAREKVLSNGLEADTVVQINSETIYPASDFSYLGITWRSNNAT